MTEVEYAEVKAAANAERMTVSAWVRRVMRDARRKLGAERGVPSTVREHSARFGAASAHGLLEGRRVRTEIRLHPRLLEQVQDLYNLPTPEAAIDYALHRVLIRPMTRHEVLAMEGTGWEGDLDAMRSADPPLEDL
jgi:Arc/MetJ family transcription regulator